MVSKGVPLTECHQDWTQLQTTQQTPGLMSAHKHEQKWRAWMALTSTCTCWCHQHGLILGGFGRSKRCLCRPEAKAGTNDALRVAQ